MLTFKVISVLLSYPTQEVLDNVDAMLATVQAENLLNTEEQTALAQFLRQLQHTELLQAQSDYLALFDRGRALSLYLFEHVHGESRDRGQAMVDLMQVYETHGFTLSTRELPDFIPLFLEFLAHHSLSFARSMLTETTHILALLATRLQQRHSEYALLFNLLLSIAESTVDRKTLAQQVEKEVRDDTPEMLDKVWEEEMVSFAPTCGQAATTTTAVPVHLVTRR